MSILHFHSFVVFKRFTALIVLLLFFSVNCLTLFSPATVQAFSIKEEKEYGENMLAVIRKEFKLVDELDVSQYVNDLGDSILAEAGPQYFDYHFYVIDNKEFNAFATPSGLIFFHSGIINAMDNEGEFVSVMAHECGHVMSRHIAARIEKSTKITAGTLALMLAGIALGGGALSQALVTGGMATGAAMNLAFSRQDEEEADRISFNLMESQQRDPNDMVAMLNKMYKESKIRMGNIPPYLLTHPQPKLRMGYVEDLIHINNDKQFHKFDQFAFRRMQKRVSSLTLEPQKLYGKYRKELREATDEDIKMMAVYGLALADMSTGNYEQAVEKMRQVMRYYPDKPILLTDLGIIYLQWGQLETALMYLGDARNKDLGSWYSTFYLALALQQSGNDKRAEALYKQVLGSSFDYPKAYFQLAQIESKKGNHALSYLYLGKFFYYEGNFTTSTFHFKKALTLSTSESDKKEIQEILDRIKKIEKDS
ncbi:MAG: M48 family metalloprotease [Proteobacteria bacterium]|nr:M48 family metalloprotease [Pseudomonadota bacterium]MBU4298293.1 M48 family metalloprotease [Pseudomonadota bacterium]MCG2747562.1 M48 family metalloprotease [Desulfobulbaceae bacterium]